MEAGTRIISIVGPESTGKSTLAKRLGEHFSAPIVPEFSRSFLQNRNGIYEESDLIEIAKGQLKLEQETLEQSPSHMICDTDLVVIKVWQEFKYGHSNAKLDEMVRKQKNRVHLLTYPDLEWVSDPLRENPNELLDIFNKYIDVLESIKANYFVVKGIEQERFQNALDHLSY
ncbi:MAG: NadR type nicotinamide-nucleotide adenylyltransferase [Bacteroidia bacterium]|jgi:NadR type nicotinamide-nucleotide adenylyltransferase